MPIPGFSLKPTALKVSILYVILAGWWFFASDNLISIVATDPDRITDLQIHRIWLFVALTALLLYILIRETTPQKPAAPSASETGQTPMQAREFARPAHVSGWIPALILAVLTAAIGATGYLAFQQQEQNIKLEKQRDLAAIGKLKADQVKAWMNGHKRDLANIADDSAFMQEVQRWLTRNTAYGAEPGNILARLETVRKSYGYDAVFLMDERAGIRLSVDEKAHPPAVLGHTSAMEAMQRKQILITDLHTDGDTRTPQNENEIEALVPLIAHHGDDVASAFGVLYFRIDPRKSLFPLIQQWPFASRSGESFLIRREGDDVLYLSDLRHRSGTAMTLRVPLASDALSATVLTGGREGVFEGADYRGVPIIAAARKIPDTSWFLLSKVDTDEIYAPIRSLGWIVASLVAIFVAVAGASIILWWRQQRAQYLLWQYESELRHQALVQHFDYVTKYANDIVLLLDAEGKIVEANDCAAASYGYPHDQLQQMNIRDLYSPGALPDSESQWRQLAKQHALVFETEHRRRSGSPFPVEVSARLFAVDGKKFRQCIIRDITERKTADAALRESETHYRQLFESNPHPMWVYDTETLRFLAVNDAAVAKYGYPREEFLGMTIEAIRPPQEVPALREHLAHSREPLAESGIWRHRKKNGEIIYAEIVTHTFTIGGRPARLVLADDVTAQREAERRNRLFAKVFENSGEAILITDAQNNIVSVNRAFTYITGFTQEEVTGRNPKILASGQHDHAFYSKMWLSLEKKGHWRGEIWNRRKNGEIYPEWITISSICSELGEVTNYVAVFSDISERKAAEERISFLAQHDILTGLPNRILMQDRLSQAIASAQRTQNLVALMFLDLDRFKIVNDSLGHQIGDQLLQAVAERLTACVRKGDTVSRVGGDEFVIILPDLQEAEDAAHVAEKMLSTLAKTFAINRHEINITPSIGISVYPHDGNDIATLLQNADAAMYHAKQRGRNNYQFFTADMTARAFERMLMENNLRRALEEDLFIIHYQPQIDIASGRIVGIEALIRWQHPEMGLVSPHQFIPVAEESGLIIAIGDMVLRKACLQNAQWQSSGLAAVPVAVNLSAVQFRQPGFYQRITEVLQETRLDPRYLELEVTETIIMEHVDRAITVAQDLQKLGVQMSIDDFGTGYSSFGSLKRLPVYKLKLDQSFVRNLPHNAEDVAITRAVIGLARSLKLRVIAEGVENREQLEFLKTTQCDEVQGYYFSKPLPADECARLLKAGAKLSHDNHEHDA